MRTTRALVLAGSLALPAGCLGSTFRDLTLPEGSIAYVIAGDQIQYHVIDTATTYDFEQTWLPQFGFAGTNCIGLLPHTATDTFGTFQFVYSGSNTGRVERRNHTTVDTIFAGLIFSSIGTHGTYAVASTGKVTLTWADGTPSQYFDPSADIQLHGDTLSSHVELSAQADSVHSTWRLKWYRGICQ